jgi:hypothetical protein
MRQMWFYTLPEEIEECGGTLPVMGQKSRTQDM